jgi:predicted DNA-binding protein with PD1-like motif
MNMKPTIEINEANFETEGLKSSQPVLVEFATRMEPSFDDVGRNPEGAKFGRTKRMKIETYLFIAGALIYVKSQPIEKGKAPGMQVQLLSENHERKEYAVIFSKGDEAFSGLNEFAEKFHVTSAHFTAIGALRGATLAWFSPERKMYKKIPVEGQLEVASMIGDIALFDGKPVVHTHMVVGLPDGTARAGHVLEAHVWPTLEVMVTVESSAMRKSLDPETGLALIDPGLANKEEK